MACRRESPTPPDAQPTVHAAPEPKPEPPPKVPGQVVSEHLGDPQFLTAADGTLYWVDARSGSLHARSEDDAGVPRIVTDSVAPSEQLIQAFAVERGTIHLLTRIDAERHPRVERVAASGGPRTVISNAIPDVLGVASGEGHVFVVVDVAPPQRSMVGEVFEVGADRKLTSLGSTNGSPRAIAMRRGELVVGAAAGLSRHRSGAKRPTLTENDFCGPGIAVAEEDVYVTRTTQPALAHYGKEALAWRTEAPAFTLPAFAVAVHAHGSSIYVGMRDSDPPVDAGSVSIERAASRALHEADESVRNRRRIRSLVRVNRADGKVTPLATFDPPATSLAVTDRGVYVATPSLDGAIVRLSL